MGRGKNLRATCFWLPLKTCSMLLLLMSSIQCFLHLVLYRKLLYLKRMVKLRHYPYIVTTAAAREALEGHCIYDGGYCKLHLSYSRHTDLNVKEKHMRVWIFDCRYPSYDAFKLGLAAATLLAFAHVIANLLGGCICVVSTQQYRTATANKQLAVAFLIFSWIVLAVALSMLIIGTLANSRSRKSNCAMLSHRFLTIGGILCFIHGLFTVPYYVSATATRREEKRQHENTTLDIRHT